MIEKFKTLFFVKSSLVTLYLALTIPIPFVSIDRLKIPSFVIFFLGLYLIINITSDYVETCNNKISYKTSLISKTLGKNNWEISWKDIKLIKSLPTSQGSKVYYFNTYQGDNFLLPQRVENFEKFILIVSKNTGLDMKEISYISPLWTYKLLTFLSVLMIVGELFAFYKLNIINTETITLLSNCGYSSTLSQASLF